MLHAQSLLSQQSPAANIIVPGVDADCIVASSCDLNASLSAKGFNALWFASLILSLMTASFGMLVKQWLREFLAGEYTSHRARLHTHLYRYPGLIKWRVFELAAILPLLLQLSLALFFAGLCVFTWSAHRNIGIISILFVGLWVLLFLAATISPVISPRSLYKTTFSKHPMKSCRSFLADTSDEIARHYDRVARFEAVSASSTRKEPKQFEEEYFAKNATLYDDLEILLAVDRMQADEELFCRVIAKLLKQPQKPSDREQLVSMGQMVLQFVVGCIENRSEGPIRLTERPVLYYSALELTVWDKIIEVMAGFLVSAIKGGSEWEDWMNDTVSLFLSLIDHPLPQKGVQALADAFEASPADMAILVTDRTPLPPQALDFDGVLKDHWDVLSQLLKQELKGVLELLHGQKLLDALSQLILRRFGLEPRTSTSSSSILEFFKDYANTEIPRCITKHSDTRATLWVSEGGSLISTVVLLLADIDRTFGSPCPEILDASVKEACLIVFTYRSHWIEQQKDMVKNWLTSRPALEWCMKLAFTQQKIYTEDLSQLILQELSERAKTLTGDGKHFGYLSDTGLLRIILRNLEDDRQHTGYITSSQCGERVY